MSCAAETLVSAVVSAASSSPTPKVRVNVRDSESWRTSTPGGADTVIAPAVTLCPALPGRSDGSAVVGLAVVAPGFTVADDGLMSAHSGSVDGT